MLKKTVNARKKYILLRSICAAVLCLILVCPSVLTVSALGVDYTDYITDITVSGHNDIVEIRIPAEEQYFLLINETQGWSNRFDYGYLDLVADGSDGDYDKFTINLHCFPGGRLNLQDIPDGTKFTAGFFYSYSGPGYETPYVSVHEQYYNSSGGYLGQIQETIGFSPVLHAGSVTHSGTFNKTGPYTNGVTGSADNVDFFLRINDYSPLTNDFVMLQAEDFVMTMTISSLYELQQTQEKTNQILEAVEDKLEANGQKLEDILNEQQQTNDKLDELPGQIGDEMQEVIENEKAEAESSGNNFVDQILGALPDPSTEVLSALGSFTDSMSYSGTDAVLPIPAIVLPGIDGLFERTEVWGGAELDFEEYLSFLPPALLILVQSLFTIAIVIFCVFELKGIISYCLTLRESKGG